MIDTTLSSAFETEQKVTVATVEQVVDMRPTTMYEAMANALLSEIQRLVPVGGPKEIADLESDDILKYLKTLLWLRVCNNQQNRTGKYDKGFQAYKSLYRQVAVPSLQYQQLRAQGEAYDSTYGIRFVDSTSITSDELLGVGDLKVISDVLIRLERLGLKIVIGLPLEPNGDLEFMAMSCVDGVVRSYKDSHPVYGFLASFCEQQQLDRIDGAMHRIYYGTVSDYVYRVSRLI
jgi:hypothetical protein